MAEDLFSRERHDRRREIVDTVNDSEKSANVSFPGMV